jgi:hypothetical protein
MRPRNIPRYTKAKAPRTKESTALQCTRYAGGNDHALTVRCSN